ncbi:head GIN domain-containing protein [Puia sp. P3]|uniref:head GIN domain-containing protein n=1 Tax=Puia sp. P3 TaxID=3423952 RepID=UPI003D66B0DF
MGYTANSFLGKSKTIWLLVALPVVMGACHNILGKRVRGNGNIKTEDRSVTDFKNVEVDGAAKVLVSQSDHSSVRIEADENLLSYMEVSQQGDRVIIRERHGFHLVPTGDIKVYVSTKVYNQIKVSGAVDIIGQSKITNPEDLALSVSGAGDIKMDVDAPRLTADVSGSGSVDLKGQTKDVDLDLTGAGHAHCYDLLAENTKVDISGAGDAEVFASVKLDANVSGAGNVNYKGNATTVNQHVSGAGSVHKAD